MVDKVITKPITADDVERRELQEQAGREIINGEWAEDNEMAGERHGRIGTTIVGHLYIFLLEHPIGRVYGDGVNYVLDGEPGNIIVMRIPDVSFVEAARVDRDNAGYCYFAPDLAVEVVSPSEQPDDTAGKVQDYLAYGTRQVWVVYPDDRRVIVHTPDDTTTYDDGDRLPGGEVLPGFTLDVAQIFDE